MELTLGDELRRLFRSRETESETQLQLHIYLFDSTRLDGCKLGPQQIIFNPHPATRRQTRFGLKVAKGLFQSETLDVEKLDASRNSIGC